MITNAERLMSTDEIATVLEARGYGYRLLSQVFSGEPSRDLIAQLWETEALDVFPFREESESIAQGVHLTVEWLEEWAPTTDEALERLRADFTHLFLGPERLTAPPWESAYRDRERLLFTEQTIAVRMAYRRSGLQAVRYLNEPDDHIGLELDFLYETCRQAAAAAGQGDRERVLATLREQSRFLDEHLLQWAPRFAGDVAHSARTDLYRGMAHMLQGFVTTDRALLEGLLAEEPLA